MRARASSGPPLPAPFPPAAPKPVNPPRRVEEPFSWPFYGYTKSHTRFFVADARMRPPFKHLWVHRGGSLLEFPPVISNDRIFQLADDGILNAINTHSGHDFWWRRIGAASASTPAVVGDRVFATVLARSNGVDAGQVVALDKFSGRTLWSRELPSRSESSPVVDHGRVFFGSEDGTVYALAVSNGRLIWSYHAAGAVKASPSLLNGILYFGDYAGDVQAVREADGKPAWVTGSGGSFYSTAAVRYGRVFLGNTNGGVYAYNADNGTVAWTVQTGAYVYSSPAATNAPRIGPTVFIGSYDGTLYAINARTGAISWHYDSGGKISGSPTIIGRILYFSDLGHYTTYGLNISTGAKVFRFGEGAFDPVISDGRSIYLSGYSNLYGLEPWDEIHHGTPTDAPAVGGPRRAKGSGRAG